VELIDWLHRINGLVSPVGGKLAICPLLAGLSEPIGIETERRQFSARTNGAEVNVYHLAVIFPPYATHCDTQLIS
jgi:hypothetical protein